MNEIDWQLLIRYVAGECTTVERERLDQWLAEDPKHGEVLAGIRRAGALADRVVTRERSATLFARIQEEQALDENRRRTPTLTFPLNHRRHAWRSAGLRIAAGLILVVGAGVVGREAWQASRQSSEETFTSSVISTVPGQRLSIRLPDSTEVVLAPGSTLRTLSTYGVRDRVVMLEGEAAFSVVHDASHPFAVRTARAVARDVGTHFVVRAYPGDASTEVVVAEGAVAVQGRDSTASHPAPDSIVIARGERVRVDARGRLELTRGVGLDSYFDWTKGRLVFRDTPLDEVAVQLGRWYNVEIRFASSHIRSLPVTATFEQQSARQALGRIAMSLGLDIKIAETGRTFTFAPR